MLENPSGPTLLGFDVILGTVAFLGFEYVLEE